MKRSLQPSRGEKYEAAMAYIATREKFGSKLGLEQIGKLLAKLGDPQKGMKFVHVAGTNGKGSTSTMIAGALTAAGYRTGLYISPAVFDFNERIQLDMEPVSDADMADAILTVKQAADELAAEGSGEATEFEVETAAAFLTYRRKQCDVAVLEVGLGGRYDATNIIDTPEAAVIASISEDHKAILGDTLAKIAAEKCGIIKGGCPVVTYVDQAPEALEEIRRQCAEKGSALTVPDADAFRVESISLDGTRFTYGGTEFMTRMVGVHFAKNALNAIEALRILRGKGWKISEADIAAGVGTKPMTARMEKINDVPCVLMDGAHNPDGIAKLCDTIDTLLAGKRIITVMGMFRDKDYAVCIPQIARRSNVFIATTPPTGRALKAQETAELAWGLAPQVCIAQRVDMALLSALRFARKDDIVLCCGSLSFLGRCKEYMSHFEQLNRRYNII